MDGKPVEETREQRFETLQFERSIAIAKQDIDVEKRLLKISVASERAVQRWDWDGPYDEILRVDENAADLARMNNAGALLADHNREKQVGVVEKAWVGDDRRAHAIVRFAKDDEGEKEFQRVLDGIRQHVSFAYKIKAFETRKADGKSQRDTVTAIDWEVLEISMVSVPADDSVGVGRSLEKPAETQVVKIKLEVDEDSVKTVLAEAEKTKERVVTVMENEQAAANEFAREDSILAFAKRFNVEERVAQTYAADKTKTVDDLRNYVADNLRAMAAQEVTPATPPTDLGLSRKEAQRYSISRAIMGSIDPAFRKAAEFEMECHDAIVARGINTQAGGFFIPLDVLQRTDLSVGGGLTLGGALVGTDHMPESFIDVLRNNMKMKELGVTIMSGLVGNPSIPRQDTAGIGYWIGEGSEPTESNLTTGQLGLSPHSVGAVQEFTRQLLIQSSPSVDSLVQNDIAAVLARTIDLAIIDGSGAANQPRGILNTTGVEEMTQIGAVFSFKDAIAFETAVAEDNAAMGTPKWLSRPSVAGSLKGTLKSASAGAGYLLDGGKMNGYAYHVSTQVPAYTLIYGDFSQVILAEWGVLEIVANDKGSTFRKGNIEVRGIHMVDVQVRYPQALKKLESFVGEESSS